MYKNGTKTIEIRKNTPRKQFNTVLIYNTDSKAIELTASFDSYTEFNKNRLEGLSEVVTQNIKKATGLELDEILDYLSEKESFVFIYLENIEKCRPIQLNTLKLNNIRPPQTYRYINPQTFYNCML